MPRTGCARHPGSWTGCGYSVTSANVARSLIVNADDFGRSPGINRGVMRAFACGILTSASLMVRWPSALDAATFARNHPELSLGLHVDLAEWACQDGAWKPVYEAVPVDDAAAVAKEVARQLATFHRLTGRDPTHLDSHQHVHRSPAIGTLLLDMAALLRIPLRAYAPRVRYFGGFYGQTGTGDPLPDRITVAALTEVLRSLPAGVTELGCHPGEGDCIPSPYAVERTVELRTLCDPRVRVALMAEGISLRSFHELRDLA